MDPCVFCRIAASEIPSQKVWESPAVFAFKDLNPQAPTHILVVPKKHLGSLADAQPQDQSLLGEVNYAAAEIAREKKLESYRLVSNIGAEAGQSVFHLHYHLLAGRKLAWPPG